MPDKTTEKQPRKFYRTVIEIEVLSEAPYDAPFSLKIIEYDITFGECSGRWYTTKVEEIDGPTMAQLLLEQASDPAFFGLSPEGRDLEDEEEDEGDEESEEHEGAGA